MSGGGTGCSASCSARHFFATSAIQGPLKMHSTVQSSVYLRLLSSVVVLRTCVYFHLTEHCTTKRTFWQHTFNSTLEDFFRFVRN